MLARLLLEGPEPPAAAGPRLLERPQAKQKTRLYRGIVPPSREEDLAAALLGKPRPGYQTTLTSDPAVAASWSGAEGVIAPFELAENARLVEFPLRKDGGINKFDFDEWVQRLADDEVLVARNTYDYGPRGDRTLDPELRYTYPADVYASRTGAPFVNALAPDAPPATARSNYLTLDDSPARAAAPDIAGGAPEYVPPPNAITLKNKGRSIVLEPDGDRLVIRHTSVDPGARGKGLGQQNIVDAVEYAIRRRKTLDSDVSFTRDAWRAWQAALKKGLVDADDIPYDAINAAMEQGGGVARNPTGESWIKDIRLGPAG
jgi:GNAT superfamily N-acetyltransferase